jgi:hypothetical protein
MSWFQQQNFGEFYGNTPILQPSPILQPRRNKFKDFVKYLKRIMSWFGNFAPFYETHSNNPPPTDTIFEVIIPTTPAVIRQTTPAVTKPEPELKTVNVSESERNLINNKFKIDSNLIKSLLKMKNDHAVVSEKLSNFKKEFDENAKKIKNSEKKIKELIDESNDQELTDVLTKRIKNNPLHQKNEELEILIGELENELLLLKEVNVKKNVCGICFEAEVNCFNKNCGHSFCETCMKKTTKCAACRIKIYRGDICKIF